MNNLGSEHRDSLNDVLNRNSGLTIALFVSVFINLILVFAYINIETNVKVEFPPKFITNNTDKIEFDISNSEASEDYYKIWGYYYINETATFESKEIKKKMQLITKGYDPKLLKKERKEITDEGKEFVTSDFQIINDYIKNIRSEKIKQVFVVKKVHDPLVAYGNNEASVKIEGLADQIFEKSKNNPINKSKPCNYTIAFKRSKGVLYVTGYQTNCFD